METSKKYELTTIKDIFDTVPVDKIDACLAELAMLMKQVKHVDAAMCLAAETVTGVLPTKAFVWPEPVTWIDDGNGVIEVHYINPSTNESLIETKMTVGR